MSQSDHQVQVRLHGDLPNRTGDTKRFVLVMALAMGPAFPAFASSDDAWAQFRAEVETACRKAAEPLFETALAQVDPFGTQSHGLALVTGKAKGADAAFAATCVYDKNTKAVEIGGELSSPE